MNIDEWLFSNINIEDMINQKTRFLTFFSSAVVFLMTHNIKKILKYVLIPKFRTQNPTKSVKKAEKTLRID